MNPFEMVVLIVAIVMIAGVIRAKYSHQSRGGGDLGPKEQAENLRLREEVTELKERIKVLERIWVRERKLSVAPDRRAA